MKKFVLCLGLVALMAGPAFAGRTTLDSAITNFYPEVAKNGYELKNPQTGQDIFSLAIQDYVPGKTVWEVWSKDRIEQKKVVTYEDVTITGEPLTYKTGPMTDQIYRVTTEAKTEYVTQQVPKEVEEKVLVYVDSVKETTTKTSDRFRFHND